MWLVEIMAQNNGLIIGIIAVLIIGGVAWYLFSSGTTPVGNGLIPSPTVNPENKLQLMATLQSTGLDTQNFQQNQQTLTQSSEAQIQQFVTEMSAQEQLFTPGEAKDLATIYVFLGNTIRSQRELLQIIEQIDAIPFGALCSAIQLVNQRNSVDQQKIDTLHELTDKINEFNAKYPNSTIAQNVQFPVIDYDEEQVALNERKSNANALEISCAGETP